MNEGGESDESVVPEKSPNKEGGAPFSAEEMVGRASAKGNPSRQTRHRTQSRGRLQRAQTRVRRAATLVRQHLRQEPSAGKPLAGIRTGGRRATGVPTVTSADAH
jgi:hypothetical protein